MSNQIKRSEPDQGKQSSDATAQTASGKSRYVKLDRAPKVRNKDRTGQELRLALESLKEAGLKVSVVAVAEVVGVDPSLVHHVYPELAREISDLRRGSGPTRKEREESRLGKALRDLEELHAKLEEAERSVKTLISRNAALDLRIRNLETKQVGGTKGKVVAFNSKSKGKTV